MKLNIEVIYRKGIFGLGKKSKMYNPKNSKEAFRIIDNSIEYRSEICCYLNNKRVHYIDFLKEIYSMRLQEKKIEMVNRIKTFTTNMNKKYDIKVYAKDSDNMYIHYIISDIENGVYVERRKISFMGKKLLGDNQKDIENLYSYGYKNAEDYVNVFKRILSGNNECRLVISSTFVNEEREKDV